MEEDVGRRRGCAVVGERELLLGGRTVVGTDNSITYFEFTSFPPWLAAFLAIARLDWLDIVSERNLMRKVCDAAMQTTRLFQVPGIRCPQNAFVPCLVLLYARTKLTGE